MLVSGRAASRRPPRSVGTTVLSDALRRPPRYSSFPPDPQLSLADIQAIRAGEARRVGCYLRAAVGSYPRRYTRGTLEVGGQAVSWKPVGRGRKSRRTIDVRRMSVIDSRSADHRERRFGSPGNIHLFALVRCSAPEGPLDLVVPAADVPMITWFFGGQPDVPESALVGHVVASGAPLTRSKKLSWAIAGTGGGLVAATTAAGAAGAEFSRWLGIPYGIGCVLLLNSITHLARGRRKERPYSGGAD
jgi:hypothetical protein